MEPFGWDRHDNTYFVLDDNRMYRLTEPPPAAPKVKKNSKKAKAAARASKRRRVSSALDSEAENGGDEATENEPEAEDDGLGGMKWECIAATLGEVRQFLADIQQKKTGDPDEKVLREQIQNHLVPILEGQEERRMKREREREKELVNMEKMANAKRSSRIAGKVELQKQEDQAREEQRRRQVEEAALRKQEQQQHKMERERDNRIMSREQRLVEREARRLQHQEELAQLSEDSRNTGDGPGRMSERQRLAEIEKNKQALKELEDADDWVFDCECGLYGQVDDGEHSVACERCNVWQHSKCLGISEEDAEREDFHFICDSCRRAQEEPLHRRPVIKIKVNRPASSPAPRQAREPTSSNPTTQAHTSHAFAIDIPVLPKIQPPPASPAVAPASVPEVNGVHISNAHSVPNHGSRTVLEPPHQGFSKTIPIKTDGTASREPLAAGGLTSRDNPFSSPHPDLSPPAQSPNKSRAYGTIYDQPGLVVHNGQSYNRPPVLSPPGLTGRAPEPTPSPRQQGLGASSTISPVLTPGPRTTEARYDEKSTPLPPSRAGLSPTKHSPLVSQGPANHGIPSSSPTAPVLPPVEALSPSPREPVLTPPVKLASVPRQDLPQANA